MQAGKAGGRRLGSPSPVALFHEHGDAVTLKERSSAVDSDLRIEGRPWRSRGVADEVHVARPGCASSKHSWRHGSPRPRHRGAAAIAEECAGYRHRGVCWDAFHLYLALCVELSMLLCCRRDEDTPLA